MADDLRTRILKALARGDGQMLDGFDLGHAAEMMYGRQADAIDLLIGQELKQFARDVGKELRQDAALSRYQSGDRHRRRALNEAAVEVARAGMARAYSAQQRYNHTPLSKPLADVLRVDAAVD